MHWKDWFWCWNSNILATWCKELSYWKTLMLGKIEVRRRRGPTPVFLPGESPWTDKPAGLQSMGSWRVGHDWTTKHSTGKYQGEWLFNCIIRVYLSSVLYFECQTVFQSVCTILLPCQKWMRVPIAPHPSQYLELLEFWILTILLGV